MKDMMIRYMTGLTLMAMAVFTAVSCTADDKPSADAPQGEGVSLAFNVSAEMNHTRMSDAVVQTSSGFTFRELKSVWLFPFDVGGVIEKDQVPLTSSFSIQSRYASTYHYYQSGGIEVPGSTASFLCYARAVPVSDKFRNGSTLDTIGIMPNTSEVTFTPEQINKDVSVSQKARDIAAYLTAIAQSLKTAHEDALFLQLVNEGRLVAASSTNVERMAALASASSPADLSGYPASLNLPDGVAVVKWNYAEEKFEPQTVTTTEANINRLDRFVYPAELWYYANSRIKTSASGKKEYLSATNWADVLREYETDNGVVTVDVHSVAIKEPLSYGVGCLRIGLTVGTTIEDAEGKVITLGDTTFPLTGVLVSGQYKQAFDFTPLDDVMEYIAYDKEVSGLSMGASKSSSPATATPSVYNNTLVLQSKDGADVRFALEFTNDSGQDFKTLNGTVYSGTKFYLVGTVDVPSGQSVDYRKRAFTKGYYTQGTVHVTSLRQAYPYLPDLLDPRLEIGVRLVPDWMQASTTSIPL